MINASMVAREPLPLDNLCGKKSAYGEISSSDIGQRVPD
jgi:hypothetical protein